MARKREVLPPTAPLYCVPTLPSKTNTTANIGVQCFVALTVFAYHNKHWWQAFWIYQHRWLWTTLNSSKRGF